jgi:hypothetical protein
MGISSTVAGWIAIGACALAAASILAGAWYWRTLRRMLRSQQVVLGDGKEDLVDFAIALQTRIDDLHRSVDEIAAGLARVDRRIDRCLARAAVVRFDAYEDTGGHQSSSFAILDGTRSGIVVSAIQGRDYARIYVKDVERGRPSAPLSPEETEAVERAMSGAV